MGKPAHQIFVAITLLLLPSNPVRQAGRQSYLVREGSFTVALAVGRVRSRTPFASPLLSSLTPVACSFSISGELLE